MRTWPALKISFDGAPDLLQAALLDYRIVGIDETETTGWRVFFADAADRDAAVQRFSRVAGMRTEVIDIADEDWATRSQASIRAVQIRRIIVAPPWDVPGRLKAAPTNRLVIVIQPSTGFGTGHHATTRLCLAALQDLDVRGRTTLDIGTGSGVLAIAASLLGAADARAIDDDPDAVQAARQNLALNPAARVTIEQADLRAAVLESHDVITANLTGALLIQAAGRLQDLTASSGHLILSGFMVSEEADVRNAFDDLAVGARAEEDEWVCFTLHKTASPHRA